MSAKIEAVKVLQMINLESSVVARFDVEVSRGVWGKSTERVAMFYDKTTGKLKLSDDEVI